MALERATRWRHAIIPFCSFLAAMPVVAYAQDTGAAIDPGVAGAAAAQYSLAQSERARACRQRYGARSRRCAIATTSRYEQWRNRPGKRDCGAYNWKCPAKPRTYR